jgi:AcrR family transcriptional regulator
MEPTPTPSSGARPLRPDDGRLQRGRRSRAQIRAAFRALFREHGFDRTTLRAIAERAGMGASSIYRHIRSKEDMVEDLADSRSRLPDPPVRSTTVARARVPRRDGATATRPDTIAVRATTTLGWVAPPGWRSRSTSALTEPSSWAVGRACREADVLAAALASCSSRTARIAWRTACPTPKAAAGREPLGLLFMGRKRDR